MKFQSFYRSRRKLLLGAALALLLTHMASAQEAKWPTQTVKIVVGTGPGSQTDMVARLLAPRLEALWKQPVVVENKAGAGGIIGTEYTLSSKDGHTLLMASPSMLLAKYTTPNLRFDPLTDLIPVYRVFNSPVIFVTNAKTAQQANTMADIVKLSKSTPDGIFFGGAGPTSFFTISIAAIGKPMGLNYSTIDYAGMGPLILGLMRDDTQLAMSGFLSVKGQIDSKDLHPLAVIDSKRLPGLPDVPTLEEAVGYKGFLPVSWGGIFVPKGTSPAVVETIGRSFAALYADEPERKALEQRLSGAGTITDSSPAQFSKEYADEAAVWEKALKEAGLAVSK